MGLTGAISRPPSLWASVQLFFLCRFHWRTKSSRVSLEFLGVCNIFLVLGNRSYIGQNQGARSPVSATFSVSLSEFNRGYISAKRSVQLFFPCQIHWKPRYSRGYLESVGLGNDAKVLGDPPWAGQNQGAHSPISATFSVSLRQLIKGYISAKPSVQLFFPCLINLKPRSSRISLESLGLGNVLQVLPKIDNKQVKIKVRIAWSRRLFQ